MKKYARLRSSSSITEQCEPSGRKPSELVPTTLALDDDFSTFKWKSSSNVSVAAASSVHDQGESGVSSSASHRALADALKKLSCLRETQHDDDPGLPRLVTTPHWGASSHMADSYAGSGEPASHSSFSAGKWPRPSQCAGAEEQGGSHSSHKSVNVRGAPTSLGSMTGITRIESGCTRTNHYTHRRSSSMHDIVLSQPAARPSAIHGDPNCGGAGKSGILVTSCFPDVGEPAWSPPQLRSSTGFASAGATAPSIRRLPADPLQTSCRLWEEEDPQFGTARSAVAKRTNGVQSMRYDGGVPAVWTAGEAGRELALGERTELQSQSVREGAAHASAIAAMAQAYAEKYGVAQAVVECVSCGRGLGVIVEGNSPGSYDSSFCRSCRPPVLPVQAAMASAAASSASKKGAGGLSRGMMQYCRKLLLRIGKKPSHKYALV